MKTTSGTKIKNVKKVYHLGNTNQTNETTKFKRRSPTAFFTGIEKSVSKQNSDPYLHYKTNFCHKVALDL